MARKKKKSEVNPKRIIGFMGDGIWEIALGVAVIWAGVIIWQKWSAIYFLAVLVLGLLIYFLKKSLIFPRRKLINYPAKRTRASVELLIVVMVVLVGLLSILKNESGIIGYIHYIQANALVMTGISATIIAFFIAFATRSPQYNLHGLLLFMTSFIDAMFFKENPIGLVMGAGFVMVVSGVVNLRRFLELDK